MHFGSFPVLWKFYCLLFQTIVYAVQVHSNYTFAEIWISCHILLKVLFISPPSRTFMKAYPIKISVIYVACNFHIVLLLEIFYFHQTLVPMNSLSFFNFVRNGGYQKCSYSIFYLSVRWIFVAAHQGKSMFIYIWPPWGYYFFGFGKAYHSNIISLQINVCFRLMS